MFRPLSAVPATLVTPPPAAAGCARSSAAVEPPPAVPSSPHPSSPIARSGEPHHRQRARTPGRIPSKLNRSGSPLSAVALIPAAGCGRGCVRVTSHRAESRVACCRVHDGWRDRGASRVRTGRACRPLAAVRPPAAWRYRCWLDVAGVEAGAAEHQQDAANLDPAAENRPGRAAAAPRAAGGPSGGKGPFDQIKYYPERTWVTAAPQLHAASYPELG